MVMEEFPKKMIIEATNIIHGLFNLHLFPFVFYLVNLHLKVVSLLLAIFATQITNEMKSEIFECYQYLSEHQI